ncbi:MAG: DNA-3-methyladenine glycosylase [Candidatus Taylorbacteria bacterium]
MKKVLPQSFFTRLVAKVAPELLGKYLVRRIEGKEVAYKITETEMYDGEGDLACHASRGKTSRTEVMYEKGGVFYVYFTYGMHYMLNVVTGDKGYPSAVLIRGVEGKNGPGRITKFLQIDKSLNGKSAARKSGLWFEDRGVKVVKKNIKKTPRIGVDYAGPVWSKKLWRFALVDRTPLDMGRKKPERARARSELRRELSLRQNH